MFEHYGFLDALCAVKKYIIWIVIAAVLFGVFGIGIASAKNDAMNDENYVAEKQTAVIVSEYYFVSGTMKENEEKNQLQYNRDIALAASAMLNADYTRQSVFDIVIEEFEIERLMGNRAEIRNKYADKVITNQLVGEFVTVAVLPDSSILKIVVNTEDENISERLLELYREKFVSAMKQINETNIECTYASVADTKIGTESAGSHTPVSGGVSTKKYVIIFALLGGALAVCAVFVWTLFFPVINRRSDVEGYGVRMVADKKEKMDFVLNNIINVCGDKDDGKVAFVVCRGGTDKKRASVYLSSLTGKAAESSVAISFSECYDAASDYDSYLKVKECGRAIIAVSYSHTKHTEYQKTVSRLRENGIEILGSVAI